MQKGKVILMANKANSLALTNDHVSTISVYPKV